MIGLFGSTLVSDVFSMHSTIVAHMTKKELVKSWFFFTWAYLIIWQRNTIYLISFGTCNSVKGNKFIKTSYRLSYQTE